MLARITGPLVTRASLGSDPAWTGEQERASATHRRERDCRSLGGVDQSENGERLGRSVEDDSTRRDSPIFFFNDTATTEIYTLSLHDALPILACPGVITPGQF